MAPSDLPINVTEPALEYNGSTDSDDGTLEMSIADFLFVYPAMLFLIAGTIGNTLSFLVFSRKNMKSSVTSVFFRILAITDTLVLWSSVPVFFIAGAFHIDITASSSSACKFFTPFLIVCCYTSCWILVLICVDRFIGIYFPHKYRQRFTRTTAAISIAALCVIFTVSVGAYLMTIFDIQEDGACGVSADNLYFFINVWPYLDLVFLNLIPTLILVALNIAIIVKITRAASHRKISTCSAQKAPNRDTTSSATAILISVSTVYVLCTIPTSTKFLIIQAFEDDAHGKAQATLYTRACLTLYLFNHAVNFFLYCAHGTVFQRELKEMLWPRCLESSTGTSTEMSWLRKSSLAPSEKDSVRKDSLAISDKDSIAA